MPNFSWMTVLKVRGYFYYSKLNMLPEVLIMFPSWLKSISALCKRRKRNFVLKTPPPTLTLATDRQMCDLWRVRSRSVRER